jgi:uncharacterized protein with von Willebrand factor type A (vWA) domain
MPVISLTDLLGENGNKIGTPELQLPDSVLTHDSMDSMQYKNFRDDSPRFRAIAVDEAPQIPREVPEPDPIDMTAATPEEFIAYQEAMKAHKDATENAPAYHAWAELCRDVFYSYHAHFRPEIIEPVDPRVELHKRIMPKLIASDSHSAARNTTMDDASMAGIATMAFAKELRRILTDELLEQSQESQEYSDLEQQVRDTIDQLGQAQGHAQELADAGQPVPANLTAEIDQLAQQQADLQQQAADVADNFSPMDAQALAAIERAAQAAHEAAEQASNVPKFGSGLGKGEPVYESPEQALTIAQMWAENPQLRAMAERFGRLDRDIRFRRAKRIVGGNDEIVDVEFGDNLNRVLSSELSEFADDDLELGFLQRYGDQELLQFSTVGEEHAGRGPIIVAPDASYSMKGERNIWARAVCMCLLHIARLEKRDFACVEWADMDEVFVTEFKGREAMDAQKIVDMASHFFGGGTAPYQAVKGAADIMQRAPEFKKADIVLIGDGDAPYGDADKRLRNRLNEMGVRIFGIAIGRDSRRFPYLEGYSDYVVRVEDFELNDPSHATAELAVHLT